MRLGRAVRVGVRRRVRVRWRAGSVDGLAAQLVAAAGGYFEAVAAVERAWFGTAQSGS